MRGGTRPEQRVPARAIGLCLLALVVLAQPGLADGAPPTQRVSQRGGTRLDSLHQLASSGGMLHLAHARIAEGGRPDQVVIQRSRDGGSDWTKERALFTAGARYGRVLPNIAVASRGSVVAVAFRVQGAEATTLFVRTSRDGGRRFGKREAIASRSGKLALGVPAVAVGDGVLAVAWTDRADGEIRLRRSRDGGRSFTKALTLGRTRVSIECRGRVTDGLVGLTAAGSRLYLSWSDSSERSCMAGRIVMRTSPDGGGRWRDERTVTGSRSYGWAELAASGATVLATVQLPSGRLLVARSRDEGRSWRQTTLSPRRGRTLSAGDILIRDGRQIWVAFVEETISGGRLRASRVRAIRSKDAGASFGRARTIAGTARSLRQAVNLADTDRGRVAVYQSGSLSGQPRNLLASRWR
jgi:hypothetical protein